MMTAEFITKRPHKKSRGGCQTCKTRKIKCDEAQPKCSFCEKRKLTCSYAYHPARSNSASPASSQTLATISRDASPWIYGKPKDISVSWDLINVPSPSVVTTSGGLSREDLRMMHHWSTFTWKTLTINEGAKDVIQMTIPQLAFNHDFLLNAMLGIASLHRHRLLPDKGHTLGQVELYRARALSGFRQAIARLCPSSQSYEAALIMSLLLIVLCAKDYSSSDEGDLAILRWIVSYRGLTSIILLRPYPQLAETSIGPVFRRELTALGTEPVLPIVLLRMFEEVNSLDPDYEYLEFYCNILDALGVLYASLRQDGLSPAFFVRVISWPSFSTQPFANCVTEKRPRALIILAHYLAIVKLVKGLWWAEGMPDHEIQIIGRMVGPKWLSYIEVPLQVTQMSDTEEIASLLLS